MKDRDLVTSILQAPINYLRHKVQEEVDPAYRCLSGAVSEAGGDQAMIKVSRPNGKSVCIPACATDEEIRGYREFMAEMSRGERFTITVHNRSGREFRKIDATRE
jgi:hypothetical protein